MNRIRLTHIFSHFRTLGGVESVLRHHLHRDGPQGIDSSILALFEPGGPVAERVTGLGLTWRHTIASARRRLAAARIDPSTTVVYHNAWGLPFLADLDRAQRRLSLLHSDLPQIRLILKSQPGLVDGLLCVSDTLQAEARNAWPDLASDRIGLVPYPIAPPGDPPARRPLAARPIVCGFVGRVVREQKRVDRLPQLCQALDQSGLDYRFEILGDGPDRVRLERQFQGHPQVLFHGRQQGADYWRILGRWDVVVFVSDYEGLPIALLEALSQGVLPIYPRIGSGGDRYAARVGEDFLYPSGDFSRVPTLLRGLQTAAPATVEALRAASRQLAAPHQGEAYERTFSDFVRSIGERPRISAETFSARPFIGSDYCPFALLRRFYYRGLFARNDRAS